MEYALFNDRFRLSIQRRTKVLKFKKKLISLKANRHQVVNSSIMTAMQFYQSLIVLQIDNTD